jgi:hypothetical protein
MSWFSALVGADFRRIMKFKPGQFAIAWILFISIPSPLLAVTTLDDWVAQNSSEGEKLLCKREFGGEYFFLARTGDKARLGNRLDMTGSYASSVAWVFQNERLKSLAVKVPPVEIKHQYVLSEDKVFADDVQYQTLDLKDSKTMDVTIEIKKCPTSECKLQETRSKEEKRYTIKVCEVPLKD